MNVKEHLAAGHYPKDDDGRPLVWTSAGQITVVATDRPGHLPILGWTQGGDLYVSNGEDIRPPTPRKVKVTRWIVLNERDQIIFPVPGSGIFGDPASAKEFSTRFSGAVVVELTGEYEEPWP